MKKKDIDKDFEDERDDVSYKQFTALWNKSKKGEGYKVDMVSYQHGFAKGIEFYKNYIFKKKNGRKA